MTTSTKKDIELGEVEFQLNMFRGEIITGKLDVEIAYRYDDDIQAFAFRVDKASLHGNVFVGNERISATFIKFLNACIEDITPLSLIDRIDDVLIGSLYEE